MKAFFVLFYVALATKFTTLIEDLEDFRKKLVEMPDDFFDLELDMHELIDEEDEPEILNEAMSIRKKLVVLSDIMNIMMDMELGINTLDEALKDDSEDTACQNWYLGMNLNPADGHIMDYTTGWASGGTIGNSREALTKDYMNELVWNDPANMIAIVRHQVGIVDAVKVFNFKQHGLSLLERFQDMNPGRIYASDGGPVQVTIAEDAENLADDPIFSVGGDLVINWAYSNNGARIALSGGHLSLADANDWDTHGLGNHYQCNPMTGIPTSNGVAENEISNMQYCPALSCNNQKVQGTDHGSHSRLTSGPVYGNYAIYVSRYADTFPSPGTELDLIVKSC